MPSPPCSPRRRPSKMWQNRRQEDKSHFEKKMDWSWFKENLFLSLYLRLLTVMSILNPLLVWLCLSPSLCGMWTAPSLSASRHFLYGAGRAESLNWQRPSSVPIFLLATWPRVRDTVPIGEAEASTPCPGDGASMMPAVACRCAINVTLLCLPTWWNSYKTGHSPSSIVSVAKGLYVSHLLSFLCDPWCFLSIHLPQQKWVNPTKAKYSGLPHQPKPKHRKCRLPWVSGSQEDLVPLQSKTLKSKGICLGLKLSFCLSEAKADRIRSCTQIYCF